MTTPQSPQRAFNGFDDVNHEFLSEAKFAQDINGKMRVPKRIRANGECSDEDLLLSNQNGMMNSWNYNNKISMNVPERIVVVGQDQHLGTRSAPREIILENSILPKDPGVVRVATPPRVISLSSHHFPSASEEGSLRGDEEEYIHSNGDAVVGFNIHGNEMNSFDSDSENRATTDNSISKKSLNFDNDRTLISQRAGDITPTGDFNEHEEILYLRRQLAKVNRRILSIEIDNNQRSQREKLICCLGIAYFILKTIVWLNKN